MSPRDIVSPRDLEAEFGLSGEDLAELVAEFVQADRLSYAELARKPNLADQFSARFLRENNILPFVADDGRYALAVSWPPTCVLLQAVELVLGAKPALFVLLSSDLEGVLSERLAGLVRDQKEGSDLDDITASQTEGNLDNLRDLASGAPVVRAVNDLFDRAMEAGATDLHIEPMRDSLTIRLRVDGLLRSISSPPRLMAPAIVSRIKILAGLNIAERRLPQDGAARIVTSSGALDVRVAIMPSPHGENAVVRLLPRERGLVDLSKVGFLPRSRLVVNRILDLPHGMVIITGPTGSGKTTTLASALAALNQPHRKILTIEDPIEYEIQGICQSQVKPEIGLTFATAMRAFVRQDPDVIMVGEIRDSETANIAVNAALTGHLVLTTLHTETATAAIPRLIDLGVDDFLLRSTIRAVIAQRLVRVLCPHCKAKVELSGERFEADPRLSLLGLRAGQWVCEPVGCERCGQSGFRGRTGIFEIFEPTATVRPLIRRGTDAAVLEDAANRDGFQSMTEDALEKCLEGITSPSEILRVTTQRAIA